MLREVTKKSDSTIELVSLYKCVQKDNLDFKKEQTEEKKAAEDQANYRLEQERSQKRFIKSASHQCTEELHRLQLLRELAETKRICPKLDIAAEMKKFDKNAKSRKQQFELFHEL